MKKNYFLRTAILLVALLCGTSAWAVSITQNVTFNDWSKLTKNGSGYAAYKGEQTFPGSDGVDYTWTFVADVMAENSSATAKRLQMKKSSGQLDSPVFETAQGFNITVTYESKQNISITEIGTENTITGASPLTLMVSSPNAGVTINASSETTYINQIEVAPITSSSLQNPELAFTGITGDVTKQLTDGSYSSAATTVSDATITYSSSDTEVATVNQEGLVTLVAGGTTVIKAEVAETETFDAASVEYTLKVVDPALVKTFVKVTDGTVTDGQYIIVYQKDDNDASVWAMNTTNTNDYFEYTIVELTDGKIVTDDESIIWTIALEDMGHYSISNNGVYVAYDNEKGGNKAYTANEYSVNAGWNIEYNENVFTITNAGINSRLLQFNSNTNQERFACYTGSLQNLTLYKLEVNDGKQDVKVTFNEVSGNKDLFFAEGLTYNSAATATPEKPITYSSSDQEVATISAEGLVTIVGPGTTIIKATTEADDTYREGVAQYTLTVRASSASLPHSIDFKSGLGDWLSITTVGEAQWESDSQYGAKVSGYINGKNTDSEAYLISPAVTANNIILNFSSAYSYEGNALELLYSSDYDPNTMQPGDAEWVNITDRAAWSEGYFEWAESGDIELKDLTAPIRFAFKYTSTTAGASTWEITDLMIKEGSATGIASVEVAGMKIIGGKGQVTIEATEAATVAVYALTGAQVRQIELTEGSNIVTLPAGIYIIGNQKVVVF